MSEDALMINMFIGPQGTVSPLHVDPRHNFFCQIRGRKFVRLINPIWRQKLYLFEDLMRKNTSQVMLQYLACLQIHKFRSMSRIRICKRSQNLPKCSAKISRWSRAIVSSFPGATSTTCAHSTEAYQSPFGSANRGWSRWADEDKDIKPTIIVHPLFEFLVNMRSMLSNYSDSSCFYIPS